MPEQLLDAHLLGGVVLDDQEAFASRRGVRLDSFNGGLEAFGRRGLGNERERAAREPMLSIFVKRHNLHGNVSCLGVVLQLAEHRPSEHVRQEHIERYGGGTELLGQRQRFGAAHRHQGLEPFVAGEIGQNPSVVRIVFDNQQGRIARLHLGHDHPARLRRAAPEGARTGTCSQRRVCESWARRFARTADARGSHVSEWQIQREGTADAW